MDMDWNDHFSIDKTFAVDCSSDRSPIKHTRFAALRVKDAVVDQFRDRFSRRPSIDTDRPNVRIHLYLKEDLAKVSLDLSGGGLHRRGYRVSGGETPLKESLAAGIVSLSGWGTDVTPESMLLDPMCGSGTLLIEAAFIYGDIAPGLGRKYYAFSGRRGHDQALWDRILAEAVERRQKGIERPWPRIVGYDANRETVRIAQENVRQAGLTGIVHVERKDLAWLRNPLKRKGLEKELTGLLVVNPPYGERQGSIDTIQYLYRCLGRKIREEFPGWQAGVFTGHGRLVEALGMRSTGKYRLYNGPIPCQLRTFDVPAPAEEALRERKKVYLPSPDRVSGDFANRLRKNIKKLSRWVNKESVSCYRIYDADIPEYNAAVDLYGSWLHVQEYAPPKTVDREKAALRIKEVMHSVQEVLGVKRNMTFLKVRHKQKGKAQYQKRGSKGRFHEVWEDNCCFLVNFTDYLNTGLFLDHRILRRIIQDEAAGKRFLNLFAYTGSATVHAAMGGAGTSTSVDLSPVYVEWARSNLALNGFSETNHRMVQADCMKWLAKTREQFDLILVDPPTFSNSKRIKRVFDVQGDHVPLIRSAMRRLEPGGTLFFSTNFRTFKLENDRLSDFHLEEISHATIPRDFERRARIHRCWKISHQN